ALAKGEWTDKSQPLVDTSEFRGILGDLQEYRKVALGLIAQHLHRSFHSKNILCKAFWESGQVRQALSSDANLPKEARLIQPEIRQGLCWRIKANAVKAEMARQGVDKVDFKFCLTWHAHDFEIEGNLVKGLTDHAPPTCDPDMSSLATLVHFIVLEKLELISDDGAATVLSDVLKQIPATLTEPGLIALELMKFGLLSGEPYEPAQEDKPFPEEIRYPRPGTLSGEQKDKVCGKMLLCRVMSLVPMRLRNVMWDSDVDFDLAAFHALVRALKRTLRQLVEGALASVLLKDLSKVKLLPKGFMCATPSKEHYPSTPAELPTFMLPRACMGIVVKYFLEYTGTADQFRSDVGKRFPCCVQPIEDLRLAITFWNDLRRCVDSMTESLDVGELSEEMRRASDLLQRQRIALNICKDG
ncbi:Prpf6, partial [Symbiodinium sp. KB8]